jgi:hypothetical protein
MQQFPPNRDPKPANPMGTALTRTANEPDLIAIKLRREFLHRFFPVTQSGEMPCALPSHPE